MSRWPLRAQLPIVALALILVAQAVIGLAALALVHGTLVGQVDSRLTTAAHAIAARPGSGPGQVDRARASDLPSDYVVLYHNPAGALMTRVSSAVNDGDLPELNVDLDAVGPYTAREGSGLARWRLVTAELASARGYVTVALPLRDVTDAVAGLRRTLILVVVATAAVGGVVAWAATRRSLAPLRDAEATASAIAAGDLSRRVPEGPPSTEAGSLARSLNAMLDRLDEAFARQAASEARLRAFLADASHELRTPLAAIRGYAELQRMGGDATEAGARIEANALRMGALVEDLLTLARYDDEPSSLAGDDEVDLRLVVEDAAADARAQDASREIAVHAPATGPEPVVRGSERHLRQLLANVCGNALRHTPSGTALDLSLVSDERDATITVRDHGPGIPADERARVFERFYRPDASRARESGGSGLGLAIVAAIVASHGGSVAAVEPQGGGTAIVIRLPLAAGA